MILTGYLFAWKHPRIRGENQDRVSAKLLLRETSPHTRGELVAIIGKQHDRGNIPAYAGRTEPLYLI